MHIAAAIISLAQTHKNRLEYYLQSNHKPKQLEAFHKHELNAMVLLNNEKPVALSQFLKCSFRNLEVLINQPAYKYYTIAKKKGGTRDIFEPEENLKRIQKRLNYYLQAYYLCIKPKEVHGFVVNPHYMGTYYNIVGNAKVHTQKKVVLNIDLKDFFPSISAKRVKDLFASSYFNFNDQIANALALLSTYQGKLPIGAPTSPVISNFVCLSLDHDLSAFCKVHKLAFSRYADDLTFSSDIPISTDQILDIINIIKKNQFKINEKKLRLKTNNRKQIVTGLTVNEKVNVDRKLLKKIRAMLHDLTRNGIDSATKNHFNLKSAVETEHRAKFIQRLQGYINFVGLVRGKNDALYLRSKMSFDEMFIGVAS
jgi:RNA-directed DNA polymerase